MTQRHLTWVAAGALAAALGAGAIGIASASAPRPATSTSAPSGPDAKAAGPHKHRSLLGRVAHGEGVVRMRGGFRTVAVQRGEITAVSASAITLKSADGYTKTYAIDDATKVRSRGEEKKLADLKSGERAMVVAVKDGNRYLAKRIAAVRAARVTPSATAGTS